MAPQPAVHDVDHYDDDVPEVTGVDLGVVVGRLQAKKLTAPGPDGLSEKVWVLALTALGP